MNMYTKLMMHLERHMYKRGRNKGEAPADKSRRGKSHFRVVKGNDNTMRVRMYGTDIITARQDGSVVIDTKGWWDSQSTVLRLNESFGFFDGLSVSMYTQRIFSYSQPILRVNGKRYRYYDGVVLSETGEFLTPMQPFEQKRIDKEESKALTQDLIDSGFRGAYKLLYATAQEAADTRSLFGVRITEAISDNNQAHHWQEIISRFKFRHYYSYYKGSYVTEEQDNASKCWSRMMTDCKKSMYVVSPSDTYIL